MIRNDSNRSRHLTRDRLLEYDIRIMPPAPHSAGLATAYPWGSIYLENIEDNYIPLDPHTTTLRMIYPWENTSLNILNHQLYLVALLNGFDGTEADFKNLFASYVGTRSIMFAQLQNFPSEGVENKLYFDLNDKILYYWKDEYIPVNAMLIANTVVSGGEV